MDLTDLDRRLELAVSYYNIPIQMYRHGRSMLELLIDFSMSTPTTIVFRPNTGWHVIDHPYQCRSMIYLLAKGNRVGFNMQTSTLAISNEAKVYVGQTINFRTRESARTPPMDNSNVKICLAHNLSAYQMDSLETVAILFCFFVFAFRTANNSVYPVHIYYGIPNNMLWNDTSRQAALHSVNTWNWSGRVLLVGTAPPRTTLTSTQYQDQLVNAANPLLNWTDAA